MSNVSELVQKGTKLFEAKAPLLSLWQDIAENFYPERADFITSRSVGSELAKGLATGKPVLVRRDLANAIGGMLRPTNKVWAHVRVNPWDEVDTEGRRWLEMAEDRQRRAMYHKGTGFARATKEGDNDFATFGQCVIQSSVNREGNNLLYRCWHLRDVAWTEDSSGNIDCVYRKWNLPAIDMVRLFPGTVHAETRVLANKDPYAICEIWHVVLPLDMYESTEAKKGRKLPFWSLHIDAKHDCVLEAVNMKRNEYTIPRWSTVSGSQYAYSPAVVVALADARTLQEMTITLLEAGEKAVSPPLLGVQGALRSDINVMAAGITWVDMEYDSRLGEVLRPLSTDSRGIPLGIDMSRDITEQLHEAFYLNKLNLPPAQDGQMTAYEVGQRVQEYIRQALPLFEPMESEYNAPLCESTFDILLDYGVFGRVEEIPETLQGQRIEFNFESPLHDAIEMVKAQKYLEATSLIANAAAVDPSVIHIMDARKGARDALQSTGVPSAWLRTEGEVEDIVKAQEEQAQIQQVLEQMQTGANVAKTIGITPSPSGTADTGQAM